MNRPGIIEVDRAICYRKIVHRIVNRMYPERLSVRRIQSVESVGPREGINPTVLDNRLYLRFQCCCPANMSPFLKSEIVTTVSLRRSVTRPGPRPWRVPGR